ncbi:importin-5-like protein [Tanacetum coccineum]
MCDTVNESRSAKRVGRALAVEDLLLRVVDICAIGAVYRPELWRVWRIEFVITLAEPRERPPGMMTKLPLFITSLFGILIIMLLDIEDQAAWHTAENHDEGSRAHAASVVLNFSENCTPDILTPDGIVSKLLVLLQNGKQMVQQGALTALASVADSSQANRMLRAKAMECVSLVGMAVGKDKFRDDAKQVMEVLMSLQGSQMEADDPTTNHVLQIMRLTSTDMIVLEDITLGDKRIGIKTSVLEEKATACNMLCCYADELKEGFFPWIDQVAPTLVPYLKLYFHEEVRKAAVSAMPELLLSSKLAIEKGVAQGRNETYVTRLSDYIVPALVEALHKEPDTKICASMLDALNECIQVITASSSRKSERAERAKAEDFDAEEGELLKEESEQEEEVFDQIGEILGTLIKTFKAAFLPFFEEMPSYLMPMWGKDKTSEERRIAICIFDDVAEQCREAALKYYDTYLPFLLEDCNDERPDV